MCLRETGLLVDRLSQLLTFFAVFHRLRNFLTLLGQFIRDASVIFDLFDFRSNFLAQLFDLCNLVVNQSTSSSCFNSWPATVLSPVALLLFLLLFIISSECGNGDDSRQSKYGKRFQIHGNLMWIK